MKRVTAHIRFTEAILGTQPMDTEIYERFIGSKAPDAPTLEQEIEAVGAEEIVERGKTGFPRNAEGQPFLWDYQIKGFFKGAAQALWKIPGTKTSAIKSYKRKIDQGIFVYPREVAFLNAGEIRDFQRPLRSTTPMGERVCLAISEEIPAGAEMKFTVKCYEDAHAPMVEEWLRYGKDSGIGQWRNSGRGRFEVISCQTEDWPEDE